MEKRSKFNYLERFSFAREITWRLCKAKPPKSVVFYVSWRHFQHANQTPWLLTEGVLVSASSLSDFSAAKC